VTGRIREVTARKVVIALPAPLRLAGSEITTREYAVVRARSDDGAAGYSYGLTRGTPVVTATRKLFAASLPGMAVGQALRACATAARAQRYEPAVARAASLMDIALWDLDCRQRGVPLWQRLGGERTEVPVMVVGGYPDPSRAPEDVGRVVAALALTYPLVKVARLPDSLAMRRLLAAATESVDPGRLVVDVGWSWRSVAAGLAELSAWGDVPLAWLEDPFPVGQTARTAALRRSAPCPIGAGDDATDPRWLRRLVHHEAVDVLRLDATTAGGVTGAVRLLRLAAVAGRPVSAHVYPQLNAHLMSAFPGQRWIETFPPGDHRVDPSELLFHGGPDVRHGVTLAPTRPGLGIDPNEETLREYAVT
jgi:L-alanine-DL-glutamate epimerase-like enolase superfamily enzyme